MFNKNPDDEYDYLLQRAKSRLLSARTTYENACQKKNEAEKYLNSGLAGLFLEMDKLETEIQQAISPEVPKGQLRMLTVRRAFARHYHVKSLAVLSICGLIEGS